jgi:hypothetical protein
MAQHTRSELYKIYKGGFHDKAFEHLVDSALNVKDDGIGINPEHGLVLTSKGPSKKLLSFYQRISEKTSPLWSVSLDSEQGTKGMNFLQGDTSRFFIREGGNVGVNTEDPAYELDVNGLVAAKGIVGSFSKGTAFADAKWHTIPSLSNMDGCQAFEIFAHINDEKDKRYGLSFATLLLSSGAKGYNNKVRTIEAGSSWIWGKFFNKIKFRWVIDDLHSINNQEKYMVQIRTRSHYGMLNGRPKSIFYRVRKLWDKKFEMDTYPETNWEHTNTGSTPVHERPRPTVSSGMGQPKKTLTIKRK